MKAWMVTIDGREAITFSLHRSRAKWIAVRAYWEAGYPKNWPKLKIRRAPEYDGCLEGELDSRAWNPAYVHLPSHMDHPGGPLDRDGVEVEEAEKGHCFDEMWGVRK